MLGLGNFLMLQSGGFYGGSVGGILAYWESIGLFSHVLPFLLIFALTFGILTKTKVFQDNRAINGIIALSVGLLVLQFNFVAVFFSEIFPRVGVGLAVILVLLILAGLFFDPDNKGVGYFLLAVGIIIFLIVVFQSLAWTGSAWTWWLYDTWPQIILVLLFLAVVGTIIGSGKPKNPNSTYKPILFQNS